MVKYLKKRKNYGIAQKEFAAFAIINLTLNETPNINGIKLSKRNISKHNKYIEYPLYLSMFIK